MRWLSSLICLTGTGCAFSDGQPWGEADLSLEARFAPPPSRLTDEGRLKTAASFAVDLESLSLNVDAVTLRMAGAGSTTELDPANPPEGYSLCHNGHCHADDGSLVDYEDIILEQSGGGYAVARVASSDPVALVSQPTAVPLGECSNDCLLEHGELAAAEVSISAVNIRGRVFDATAGERVPAEGLAFIMALAPENPIATPTHAAVENGRRIGVRVALDLAVSEKLFDDVEWTVPEVAGEPADLSAAAGAAVVEKLICESHLHAAVSRFD